MKEEFLVCYYESKMCEERKRALWFASKIGKLVNEGSINRLRNELVFD